LNIFDKLRVLSDKMNEEEHIKVDREIELKPLKLESAQAIFNLIDSCRTYLSEWLPWVAESKQVPDTEKFINETLKKAKLTGGFVSEVWFEGSIVGLIGFHTGEEVHKKITIGYWIAEQYQGKGIITKSCKAYIDYAFNELGMNRVVIKCGVENHKSIAITKRLGFKEEGIEREGELLNGKFINIIFCSVLKEEWNYG